MHPVFHKVGENLYRLESTGGYYALLKRGDKQFRRSLKTKDRKLAERRLADLRAKIDNLSLTVDGKVAFSELAAKWLESVQHTIKPSTFKRMQGCVKNLIPFFSGITVRNSTLYRLRGELLLAKGAAASEAEQCFHQAVEIARHQSAKSRELRAAMSLARLWQKQGKREEARRARRNLRLVHGRI